MELKRIYDYIIMYLFHSKQQYMNLKEQIELLLKTTNKDYIEFVIPFDNIVIQRDWLELLNNGIDEKVIDDLQNKIASTLKCRIKGYEFIVKIDTFCTIITAYENN